MGHSNHYINDAFSNNHAAQNVKSVAVALCGASSRHVIGAAEKGKFRGSIVISFNRIHPVVFFVLKIK
jgi:hypothetical protein